MGCWGPIRSEATKRTAIFSSLSLPSGSSASAKALKSEQRPQSEETQEPRARKETKVQGDVSRRETDSGGEGTLEPRDRMGKKEDAEAGPGDREPTVGREAGGAGEQGTRRKKRQREGTSVQGTGAGGLTAQKCAKREGEEEGGGRAGRAEGAGENPASHTF